MFANNPHKIQTDLRVVNAGSVLLLLSSHKPTYLQVLPWLIQPNRHNL